MIDVLIMAGGKVANRLKFLRAGCECPALIPINSKPSIQYICEFYSKGWEI